MGAGQGSQGGAHTGVCAEGLEGGRQEQRWRGYPVFALTLGGAIPWEGEEVGTAWWQEKALIWGFPGLFANACEEERAGPRAGLS